jgi:hypothetical protein
MDTWLKTLIAAACIVVIGGGSLVAWDWRQERQARAAHERSLARIEKELFAALKLQPGDIDGARNWCRTIDSASSRQDFIDWVKERCVALGYM